MNNIKSNLIEYMENLIIIDAHEHLADEAETLASGVDIMTALLTHYIPSIFHSAGMQSSREWLQDTGVPLNERWAALKPYMKYVRHTGYYQTANLAAQALYGIEKIDDSTYETVDEHIRRDAVPGYYDKLLKEHCKIERVLNQRPWGHDEGYDDFYTVIVREPMELFDDMQYGSDRLGLNWKKYGGNGMNADEFARNWVKSYIGKYHGVKIRSGLAFPCPTDAEADKLLKNYIKNGKKEPTDVLCLYLLHKIIEYCGEYGLVVAVHCGINWECGQDFYSRAIKHIYRAVMTYGETMFDLYHASFPWTRETAAVGNQYPNAFLNLTWVHEISPASVKNFLNEWIDIVPLNKIIGFGADSRTPFLTAGVRKRTFLNIAEVLAVRVENGEVDMDEAREICKMWLYDNPKNLYGL